MHSLKHPFLPSLFEGMSGTSAIETKHLYGILMEKADVDFIKFFSEIQAQNAELTLQKKKEILW
jgi:hypothetical protein